MVIVIGVVLFLIGVNALYVAAEFAAVSARHNQIRRLAEHGNPQAVKLLPWLEDPRKLDEYIAVCQIGITLSSLVLGAYGQVHLAEYLAPLFERWAGLQTLASQSLASIVVLTVLTILQVVLGELIPKSVALQFSVQTALLTFVPMRWSLTAFSWFIRVLNGSGIAILKMFGVPHSKHRHVHSPDEIEMLIAESRDGGVLEPDEHMRLHRALRLGGTSARELMIPRLHVSAIDVNTSEEEVLHEIVNSPYSQIPVYQNSKDNIIGMLLVRDVVVRLIEKGEVCPIREVMRTVMIVPETLTAEALLTSMRRQRKRQAIVVDEFGGTAGLITLEDVLKEMLGEVADEFKAEKPQPETLSGGRVRLPGLTRLEEAELWVGASWRGGTDTVSGYIIESIGYFPVAGERLTIDGVEVEVEEVEHNTIRSLIINKPAGSNVRE